VGAVADRSDGNRVLSGLPEEDAVIAATKPESGEWRFELLYIAGPGDEIAIDAVQDVKRSLAVDCVQICPSFCRPGDRKPN
jgi:hypothetical protein